MSDIYDILTPEILDQAVFHKSRRSDNSGSCVEVAENLAATHGVVLVKDTKQPSRPPFAFTVAEWEAFIGGVRDGEFDL
ncbi:DUF397 domain-containing protein [Actinoplanes sp. NPDC051851]|uniref:DUF397 domain-containing protein n=1 Tax=Actinoplanes sp. NPDC051851 TaxID=3154753 RepID=UPI003421532F